MTVCELIAALRELNQDSEVFSDDGYLITGVLPGEDEDGKFVCIET